MIETEKSLRRIYEELGVPEIDVVVIRQRILNSLACPCRTTHKCIHDFNPYYRLGNTGPCELCEPSQLWIKMKWDIMNVVDYYLYGKALNLKALNFILDNIEEL